MVARGEKALISDHESTLRLGREKEGTIGAKIIDGLSKTKAYYIIPGTIYTYTTAHTSRIHIRERSVGWGLLPGRLLVGCIAKHEAPQAFSFELFIVVGLFLADKPVTR